MIRKRHLLDNQINVNLLTKIYFSVIFLLAIKLKSICNLHEHLSSLFWFVATEGVSVVSLMFLSCLRQVYEVYTNKGRQNAGDLFWYPLFSLYFLNFFLNHWLNAT